MMMIVMMMMMLYSDYSTHTCVIGSCICATAV